MSKQKILIIGGGFAGVKTALELSNKNNFDVTLVSNQTNLRYYPTLYHTATGGSRAESSIPLSNIFQEQKITIINDSAELLDRTKKTITTKNGSELNYDILIIALGMVTDYFGIKGLKKYSFGVKTIEEAMRFKQHIHQQLINDKKPDLNYVIVGGGPTGIELASSLTFYIHTIMRRHNLPYRKVHIDIVEAAPRLVSRLPKTVSKAIARRLRKLGIQIYLNKIVTGATSNELTVGGKNIRSHTIVWTAGTTNHPFFKKNNFNLTKSGKVRVDYFLSAEQNIYVLGDNADTPYSGLAQTALRDGEYLSNHLNRLHNKETPLPYKPKRPIYVIPVGEEWAAVVWGKFQFYGYIGKLLRRAADYIGFHNLEPWQNALGQWVTEYIDEESCPHCVASIM